MADEPNRHSPGATSIEPRQRPAIDKDPPHSPGKLDATGPNEGEGNKSADRAYRERTEKFVKSGRVEKAAQEAAEALDSDEGEQLRKAENKGRTGNPTEK